MAPGGLSGHAPSGGALKIAVLDQVGFNDIFNGVTLFANGRGKAIDTHRATVELMHDGVKQLAVHQVEPLRVDVKHRQSCVGCFGVDDAVGLHFGIIAHASQQPIGNSGRAAGASGDFPGPVQGNGDIKQACAARDNMGKIGDGIELQARNNAEAVAQRIG